MTYWYAGLCPYCLKRIGEHQMSESSWGGEITCRKCGKKIYPIVASRLLNEIAYAGLEEINNSEAVISVKGRKIKLKSIRDNFEISPKSPFSAELVKEGIIAVEAMVERLNFDVMKKSDVELEPALLRSIISCCYKNGARNGSINFIKIPDNSKGREIGIFDGHSSGEGNRFVVLGEMKIRTKQAFPGFPLHVFGTIHKTPSVLLFFRYFSILNDPEYGMQENEAIIFY